MNRNLDDQPTLRSVFRVPKMDCAAEEQLVRLRLEDRQHVRSMSFDLGQRTVAVTHIGDAGIVQQELADLRLGQIELVQSQPVSSSDIARQGGGERGVLRLLLSINAAMFVIECGAGIVAESTGLIADSFDMFADAAVYGVALYAVGKSAHLKLRAAHISGWLQGLLALFGFGEVVRRIIFGAEPEPRYMIGVAIVALVANVACLWLIRRQRSGEAHMKASEIFSANDVLANCGVIVAGVLVAATRSMLPDLLIGALIATVVLRGAINILRLRNASETAPEVSDGRPG